MATEPDVVVGLNDWVRAIQAERYFRSDNLGKTVRSFVSLPFVPASSEMHALPLRAWHG